MLSLLYTYCGSAEVTPVEWIFSIKFKNVSDLLTVTELLHQGQPHLQYHFQLESKYCILVPLQSKLYTDLDTSTLCPQAVLVASVMPH